MMTQLGSHKSNRPQSVPSMIFPSKTSVDVKRFLLNFERQPFDYESRYVAGRELRDTETLLDVADILVKVDPSSPRTSKSGRSRPPSRTSAAGASAAGASAAGKGGVGGNRERRLMKPSAAIGPEVGTFSAMGTSGSQLPMGSSSNPGGHGSSRPVSRGNLSAGSRVSPSHMSPSMRNHDGGDAMNIEHDGASPSERSRSPSPSRSPSRAGASKHSKHPQSNRSPAKGNGFEQFVFQGSFANAPKKPVGARISTALMGEGKLDARSLKIPKRHRRLIEGQGNRDDLKSSPSSHRGPNSARSISPDEQTFPLAAGRNSLIGPSPTTSSGGGRVPGMPDLESKFDLRSPSQSEAADGGSPKRSAGTKRSNGANEADVFNEDDDQTAGMHPKDVVDPKKKEKGYKRKITVQLAEKIHESIDDADYAHQVEMRPDVNVNRPTSPTRSSMKTPKGSRPGGLVEGGEALASVHFGDLLMENGLVDANTMKNSAISAPTGAGTPASSSPKSSGSPSNRTISPTGSPSRGGGSPSGKGSPSEKGSPGSSKSPSGMMGYGSPNGNLPPVNPAPGMRPKSTGGSSTDRTGATSKTSRTTSRPKSAKDIDVLHLSAYISIDWPKGMREPADVWRRRTRAYEEFYRTADETRLFRNLLYVDKLLAPNQNVDYRSNRSTRPEPRTMPRGNFLGSLTKDSAHDLSVRTLVLNRRSPRSKVTTAIKSSSQLGRTIFSSKIGNNRITNASRSWNPALLTKRPKTPCNR